MPSIERQSETEPVSNRRQVLIAAAAASVGGVLAIGCEPKSASVPETTPATRNDVPLRIVMVGSEDVAETITRGWSSVSEQAIDVQTIPFQRADSAGAINAFVAASAKADVLIGPASAIAELFADGAVVPLVGDDMVALGDDLFPAMRNGLSRYATELIAIPIAAPMAALWTTADDASAQEIKTWRDYDRIVESSWKGSAAEPTAGGWAAATFLWRASTSVSRWMFSRETFAPVIADEDHVECLTQMATTVARYTRPRQTAAEVYQAIRGGTVRGGLAFPTDVETIDGDWNVLNLPTSEMLVDSLVKPMPDAFSTVAMLPANCRQTEASKTFLGWLSGGEGSQASRRKMPPMHSTRESIQDDIDGPYTSWITQPLRSATTMPTLQVIASGEYYASLDEEVIRCLDGKSTAKQSLETTAARWNEITNRVGADRQLRAWRRAQGMRA